MIKLEIITTPQGGESVLVSHERIVATTTAYKSQSEELRKEAAEMAKALKGGKLEDPDGVQAEMEARLERAAHLEKMVESTVKTEKRLRELLGDKAVVVEYPFRPYTDGEKQDAMAEATTYESGEPRFNQAKYNRLLVAASCGMSLEQVRALTPARAEALILEVMERSEPDILRLRFLS